VRRSNEPRAAAVSKSFRVDTRWLDIVVGVETATEAETTGEHERGDKRGGPVARLLKAFGEKGMVRSQSARVLVDPVAGRVEAGHHRGVGGQSLGNRGIGPGEAQSARGQSVEVPSLRSDGVGARGVEGYEQDRGSNRGSSRPGSGRPAVRAGACDGGQSTGESKSRFQAGHRTDQG
jgi:hypothetical protein